MKKVLMLSLAVICCAGVASAQLGDLGVYWDGVTGNGSDCYAFEPTAPSFDNVGLAIIHDNHSGAKSIQFKQPIPGCHSGAMVSTTLRAGSVPVGAIDTGLALGYGDCIGDGMGELPIIVAPRVYGVGMANSQGPCCTWEIGGDPAAASGTVEGSTCLDVLVTNIPATDGHVVVGGADPVVSCGECEGPVPTEVRTWGAVKELYKDI